MAKDQQKSNVDIKNIQPNFLDRAISFFNPKAGAERMRYRYANALMNETVRNYDAASNSRRTAGWHATSTSANAEISKALKFLRNRSRDLVRNNPYAENAVRELANNIVGIGIIPKAIGLSKGQTKKLQSAWKSWAESTDADYDGHLNYYGIQNLAVRTVVESGEVIIRKYIAKDKAFPLQLQVLEPDFIDDTKYETSLSNGGYILYGVEFDANHKIVAYWLYNSHPGDSLMQFGLKSSRIPATDIIHLFEKKRPGQFRGVPFGHASMLRLKDLDDYEDAQLIRQKIAACFSVFVTDNEPSTGNLNPTRSTDVLEKVEPGIIEHLPSGKSVTMATPPDAGPNYSPYLRSVLGSAASGYGMDYPTFTGDLTAVNFSSGRMGWLKFHRNVSAWEWLMFIPTFCTKSWNWFIQIANITGDVKQLSVPVSWTPPRREMIDPVKEVKGIQESIRAGITSLQAAIRENGDDPEEVFAELSEMKAISQKLGLILTTDPANDKAANTGKDKQNNT